MLKRLIFALFYRKLYKITLLDEKGKESIGFAIVTGPRMALQDAKYLIDIKRKEMPNDKWTISNIERIK